MLSSLIFDYGVYISMLDLNWWFRFVKQERLLLGWYISFVLSIFKSILQIGTAKHITQDKTWYIFLAKFFIRPDDDSVWSKYVVRFILYFMSCMTEFSNKFENSGFIFAFAKFVSCSSSKFNIHTICLYQSFYGATSSVPSSWSRPYHTIFLLTTWFDDT